MADKIHPGASSPPVTAHVTHPPEQQSAGAGPPRLQPPPGTYVVQIPKDQVYRVPPPENARKHRDAARRKSRRCGCCCCVGYTLLFVFLILVAIGVVAAAFYLTVRPKAPRYTVDSISISGFNLSSTDRTLSPEFDVTVRADNPNKQIGIYYEKKSRVAISYSGVGLCAGVLPAFYQGSRNITVFTTLLRGSGVHLSSPQRDALVSEQRKGQIRLELDLKVPVKIKVWGIKSWTVDVKVRCDVKVDKLARNSKVISRDCSLDVDPWWW